MRVRGSSVRVELARLVLIVAVPLVGLVGYLLYDTARRDEQHAAERVMAMAATTADRAARYVEVAHSELRALARRPLVRAMDPKRCDPQLAELRELYGQPANIIVIDAEGRIICGAKPPPPGGALRVIDEELLRAMKAAPRFRLSRPFMGRITQRWTLAAVQPVRAPGGGLAGMVAMGFDLEHWVSFSPSADELRGTIHDIVTAEGVIIARSEDPEGWVGRSGAASEVHRRMLQMKEGTVRALGTEGADRVWGFTPVPGTDWYARSSVSTNKVLGPVRERAIDTAWVLAALLAAVFLAVAASVARLARPMRIIASAVRARAEGHGEMHVPIAGPREVAELATELNRMIDASERREAELRAAHDELARSNKELEQFAYVVSHDLQEPLRMVSNYTQLLRKRYGEQLEASAHEFMAFVIDGAARMKQLIEDLLAYSRVGTKGRELKPVKLETAVERARFNLRAALEESGGALTHDPLPEVEGDESQLVQLLQNLAGNALKFRGEAVPRVHVSAVDRGGEVEVSVQDNGIGIAPEHFERIFMVFQRLHGKGEYPGTGIGLAICKKVVERHGGRIWVESGSGRGCCFRFTLRKARSQNEPRQLPSTQA